MAAQVVASRVVLSSTELVSNILLDMIIGQGRVGRPIWSLACIIDLRARSFLRPVVRQEKLKHTFL
jgi:hypothetical protein